MKTLLKIFKILIILILLVSASTIVYFKFFFDTNSIKNKIETALSSKTKNGSVKINGDLDINFFPHVGIKVFKVDINTTENNKEIAINLDSLDLVLNLTRLLYKEFEVASILIDNPIIKIKNASGSDLATGIVGGTVKYKASNQANASKGFVENQLADMQVVLNDIFVNNGYIETDSAGEKIIIKNMNISINNLAKANSPSELKDNPISFEFSADEINSSKTPSNNLKTVSLAFRVFGFDIKDAMNKNIADLDMVDIRDIKFSCQSLDNKTLIDFDGKVNLNKKQNYFLGDISALVNNHRAYDSPIDINSNIKFNPKKLAFTGTVNVNTLNIKAKTEVESVPILSGLFIKTTTNDFDLGSVLNQLGIKKHVDGNANIKLDLKLNSQFKPTKSNLNVNISKGQIYGINFNDILNKASIGLGTVFNTVTSAVNPANIVLQLQNALSQADLSGKNESLASKFNTLSLQASSSQLPATSYNLNVSGIGFNLSSNGSYNMDSKIINGVGKLSPAGNDGSKPAVFLQNNPLSFAITGNISDPKITPQLDNIAMQVISFIGVKAIGDAVMGIGGAAAGGIKAIFGTPPSN